MLYRDFKAQLKAAGLPDMRFHDLRHTVATLAINDGMLLKDVSEMLGHSSTAVTERNYAHLLQLRMRETAKTMDRIYRKKKAS
jgi:integrase